MKVLKALILDDEARARRTLGTLIAEFCERVEVIAAAGSVDEAIIILANEDVDLLFLDVSMPEKDGFTLAKRSEFSELNIIFVTAHSKFAIEAFRVNAVDYLLKPVNITDLRSAIERVRKKIGDVETEDRSTLKVYVNSEHLYLPIKKIQYLQADGSYTYVVTTDSKFMVSRGLRSFESQLNAIRFFRTHRSYLVNIDYIERIGSKASGKLYLVDAVEIPLSRYRRVGLMELIERTE